MQMKLDVVSVIVRPTELAFESFDVSFTTVLTVPPR